MRLQVSEYAAARLDDIWDYYAAEASERVADRITKKIVDDIDWLMERPRGGQYEPLLDHLCSSSRRVSATRSCAQANYGTLRPPDHSASTNSKCSTGAWDSSPRS